MTFECACEHCGQEFAAEPEGGHRLLCGDSTVATDVERSLTGNAALCLTDPPYGIGGTSSSKNDYIEYDDSRENLIRLIEGFMPLAQTAAAVVVLTPGNANQRLYPEPTWTMAWFTPAGIGSGPWGFCCWQPILCFGKDPKLSRGEGRHPDAIVHTEAAEKNGHPCPKPIKFWCWLVERTSRIGDLIYEPFSGSGTTTIAAEMTGRTCHAIEVSPAYCDVAVKRWSKFTGGVAVLADDGRTFDELVEARGKGVAA
jgi:DNA modification methylase